MSRRTIEEKVVKMEFDNSKFEPGVKQTLSTLDKLKAALKFNKTEDDLKSLERTANSIDFSKMENTVCQAGFHIQDVWEKISQVFEYRIARRIVTAAEQMGKSLTFEQVTAGWQKYEQKTANVQTLMNSTGKSIDEINKYLADLMWYSDETSFGFTDMTSALSTMVASGGDIDKLIPMIMGMGNATAYAGKSAAEFSRVIFNLNQSYSQGFLSTMDWRSVQQAGAASKKLQEMLISAAEQVGTIQKGQYGITDFASLLTKKAITSEAMEIAFKNFADFTMEVKKAVDNGTYENATEAIEKMSNSYDEFSVTAFTSAQQAKSFSEAIDATKDAVSSGWLTTFETIFGDFRESTKYWTELTDILWDTFASGAEERNELLGEALNDPWETLTGKIEASGLSLEDFEARVEKVAKTTGIDIDAMKEKYGSIGAWAKAGGHNISSFIKTAFDGMLKDAEAGGAQLNKSVELSTEALEKYRKVVGQVLAGQFGNGTERYNKLTEAGYKYAEVQGLVNKLWEKGGKSFNGVSLEMSDLEGVISNLSDTELQNVGYTEEQIKALRELAEQAKETGTPLNELIESMGQKSGRELLMESFGNILRGLSDRALILRDAFKQVFKVDSSDLRRAIESFNKFSQLFVVTDEKADKLQRTFAGLITVIKIFTDIIGGVFKIGFSVLKAILEEFNVDLGGTSAKVGDNIVAFKKWLDKLDLTNKIINKIVPATKEFINKCKDLATKVKEWYNTNDKLHKSLENIQIVIGRLKEDTGEFFDKLKEGVNIKEAFTSSFEGLFDDVEFDLGLTDFPKLKQSGTVAAESFLSGIKESIGVGKVFKEGEDTGKGFFDGFVDKVKKLFTVEGDNDTKSLWQLYVSSSKDSLKSAWGSVDWDKVFAGGVTAGGVVGFFKTLTILEKFANPLEAFAEIASSASGAIVKFSNAITRLSKAIGTSLKRVATGIQWEMIGKALLDVAILIGTITAAVIILGKQKNTELEQGFDALYKILGIFAAMALVLKLMTIQGKHLASITKSGVFLQLGTMFMEVLGAVLIASFVIKKLGSMDPAQYDQGIKGLSATIILMGSLVAVLALVSRKIATTEKMILRMKAMTGIMLELALVLGVTALVAKICGTIEWSSFGKLAVMTGIIVGAITVLALLGNPKFKFQMIATKGTIAEFSAALLVLATAAKICGSLEWSALGKLGALAGGLVAALAVISTIVFMDGSITKFKGMMIELAAALLLTSFAFKIAGGFTPKDWAAGIGLMTAVGLFLFAMTQMTKTYQGEMPKVAGLLMGMGVCIFLMSASIRMLGGMEIANLTKGVIAVGLLGAIIAGLINSLRGKWNEIPKLTLTLLAMAVAIGILGVISIALSGLSVEALMKGVSAVAVLGLIMSGMLLASHLAGEIDFKSIISMAGAVAVLAAVVVVLAMLDPAAMDQGLRGIAALAGIFTALMFVIKYVQFDWESALPSVLTATLVVAALAAVLIALVKLTSEASPQKMEAIGKAMLMIGAVFAIVAVTVGLLGKLGMHAAGVGAVGAVIVVAAIALLGLVLAMVVALTDDAPPERIKACGDAMLAMGEMFLVMSVAMLALAAVGAVAIAAMAGAAILIGTIAVLAGLYFAVEELVKGLDVTDADMERANKFFENVGKMITVIISSIGEGIARSIERVGKALSKFSKDLKPFKENMKDFGPDVLDGIKNLSKCVLILTATDFISGLKIFGDGEDIGKSLKQFMSNIGKPLVNFYKDTSEIKNPKRLALITEALGYIVEAVDKIPSDGIFSDITDDSEDFIEILKNLAEAIKKYNDGIIGIDVDNIMASIEPAKSIIELSKSLDTGLFEKVASPEDMEKFADSMDTFAHSLWAFSATSTMIDKAAISTGVTAGNKLVDLAKAINDSQDVIKSTTGIDLEGFSDQIKVFANSILEVGETLKGKVNIAAISKASEAAQYLVDIASSVPQLDYTLSDFGDDLYIFASDLSNASMMLDAVQLGNMSVVRDSILSMSSIISGLSEFSFEGVQSFVDSVNLLAEADFEDLLDNLLSVEDYDESIMNSMNSLLTSIAEGIVEYSPIVTDEWGVLCENILLKITEYDPRFKNASVKSMEQFKIGMTNYKVVLLTEAGAIAWGIIQKLNSYRPYFVSAGENWGRGLYEGLSRIESAIYAKADQIAAEVNNRIKRGWQEASPSKIAYKMAAFYGVALENGLDDTRPDVVNAAGRITDEVNDAIDFNSSNILDFVDLDLRPTITPYLDLSQVRSGVTKLNKMMDDKKITADAEIQNGAGNAQDGSRVVNFTQNNYSPKSLSRAEIYRQTKNLVSRARG